MNTAKHKILAATSRLMEEQGYFATSVNQIIQESGTPKGSLYYYFPEGKEQLTEEAIQQAGEMIAEQMANALNAVQDPAEAIAQFVEALSEHIQDTECRLGGPLTVVSLETANTSPRLNQACQEMYRSWQQLIQAKLERSGFSSERAAALAVFINAAIEGGVSLSRTSHSPHPLQIVGQELRFLISHQTH